MAIPDLLEAVKNATLLVFVVPHQVVKGICRQLKGKLHPRARAISLIKGVDVGAEGGLVLISEMIQNALEIDTSVLMGANVSIGVGYPSFYCKYLDRE